jgi:hypothetical protein
MLSINHIIIINTHIHTLSHRILQISTSSSSSFDWTYYTAAKPNNIHVSVINPPTPTTPLPFLRTSTGAAEEETTATTTPKLEFSSPTLVSGLHKIAGSPQRANPSPSVQDRVKTQDVLSLQHQHLLKCKIRPNTDLSFSDNEPNCDVM